MWYDGVVEKNQGRGKVAVLYAATGETESVPRAHARTRIRAADRSAATARTRAFRKSATYSSL